MNKIGIIGAMESEISVLRGSMKNTVERTIAGMTFYEGMIGATQAVVVKSGIGKVQAAVCAHTLAREFSVTHVINTGIAGAVSPALKIFDIVVSTDTVYHDVDVTGFGYPPCVLPGHEMSFKAEPVLAAFARMAFELEKTNVQFHEGRIATGDVFIASSEKKLQIKNLCDPLCVEMEGAAIAHACFINSIPFIIIRCISDLADDTGTHTYEFNELQAAHISSSLVLRIISMIQSGS